MSARASTASAANTCSGAMYSGVPMTTPGRVSWAFTSPSVRSLAMPKSRILTSNPWELAPGSPGASVRKTFSGFMSRCTTP